MKNIIAFFRRPFPFFFKKEIPKPKTETFTIAAPGPEEDVLEQTEKRLAIAYKQYRRAMLTKGNTPATRNGWMKTKHRLHSHHFGTFSPIKPL